MYTGYCSNLISRFHSHNTHSNTDWTKSYRPWAVLHCEYFETKSEALKREKELKSGKGREWINLNIENWKKSFG
jgi:putative endonuclease